MICVCYQCDTSAVVLFVQIDLGDGHSATVHACLEHASGALDEAGTMIEMLAAAP